MASVKAIAGWMHDRVCVSQTWENEKNRADHLRVFRPTAVKALTSDDPATYIHDHICQAELNWISQRTFYWNAPDHGCPVRQAHIDRIREMVTDLA